MKRLALGTSLFAFGIIVAARPTGAAMVNNGDPIGPNYKIGSIDAGVAVDFTATAPDPSNSTTIGKLTVTMGHTNTNPLGFHLTENAPAGPAGGQVWRSPFEFAAVESGSFAQRDRYRGRRGDRNRAAQAEVIVGAIGSITGAAILVYANRPECRTNQFAGGCGYGTKVVGTAVLSAGLVGLVVGALTWR